MLDIIEIKRKKIKHGTAIILFLTIFFFRYHTLINDYYDRDFNAAMVSTIYDIHSNDSIMFSFGQPAYIFFYYPLKYFGNYNWRLLNIIAIFIIFFSSILIYQSVRIVSNKKSAFYSAFLFALFSNILNKDFLAFNAEIIFNFYIAISLFFFINAEFNNNRDAKWKKFLYLTFSIVFALIASEVKMHAKFYLLIYPYYYLFLKFENKNNKNLIIIISISSFFVILFSDLIFNFGIISYFRVHLIDSALQYIQVADNSFSNIIKRFFIAVLSIIAGQGIIWFLGIKCIFMKKWQAVQNDKFKYLISFYGIVSLITACLTLRFYLHYFIQALLPVSILAGICIYNVSKGKFKKYQYRRIINGFIFIPAYTVLCMWSALIIIKSIDSELRLSLNMLVPNTKLVSCINWLKKETDANDRIFVWGNAVEIYYFSRRLSAGGSLWMLNHASHYKNQERKFGYPPENAINHFRKNIISRIEENNVKYFIDTNPSGYSDFYKYPIIDFPVINDYLKKYYKLVYVADKILIYKRLNKN